MTFWGAFFGVFLGIISGVIINLCITWFISWKYRKKTIENLKFEIDFNIEEINKMLEESIRYRNKLNADDLVNYFGYFTLSQVIGTTISQIFQDRSIYKILDYEDIGNLQIFYKFFQPNMEKTMNDQITYNKLHFQNPGAKQQIAAQIDILEAAFNRSKSNLESIKAKLE